VLRPANIRINFTSPETRGIVLPDAEKGPLKTHDRNFIRLDTIPQRDGRTDRIPLASTALCIASNVDALQKLLQAIKGNVQPLLT